MIKIPHKLQTSIDEKYSSPIIDPVDKSSILKRGFFIMKLWQTGNTGIYNIHKTLGQPVYGYTSYDKAFEAMIEKKEDDLNWEFNTNRYTFTIMEIFQHSKPI